MNLGQVFLFIAIFSMIFTLPTIPSSYAIELPNWLKPIAIWWGEGKVTDDEFVGIIQWMLDNGLINIKESVDNDQDGYDSDIDCNDNNSTIYPGANDIPNDGIDQDCNGMDAQGIDTDGDGYDVNLDCNDHNSTIYPGANDIPNDGIDQDCDGFDAEDVAEDKDFDHYFTKNTQQSLVDCDDTDPSVFPGAPEIANDGKDNDCDGTVDEEIDNDQDGYNSDIDCNDNNSTIYPGANDIPNDGIDQDCDGMDAQNAVDNDGDGYNSNVDCDDNDPRINPGAPEIPTDGVDNDCDGTVDEG